MKHYNAVVIGGGTAGWLTALYVKKKLPKLTVTVIESSEIGILGAGEGSTPHLITFLDELEIPISKLIKETGATIKNGIKFTNWNGDGKHYYHPFFVDHPALEGFVVGDALNEHIIAPVMAIANGVSYEEYNLMTKLCEENKVPQTRKKSLKGKVPDPLHNFSRIANFSLHFDASKLASFLREIAKERGIIHIEGKVEHVVSDETGNISSLTLDSGKSVDVTFAFDCSGFHKLLIGKHFKAKWVSYKEYLPVDSAIPFFTEKESEISPYTESVSMKYGWMWRIPLQHRQGCGYVYDSSLVSEEEAKKEIEDYLGYVPEYPRADKGSFKFTAGYYETPWIKNCLAIGLSSGFIEPLEATSIFASILTLKKFLNDFSKISYPDEDYIYRFNKEVSFFTEDIFHFVYYHYLGQRNDSSFWERFKDFNSHPEYVKSMLFTANKFVLRKNDFAQTSAFALHSWLAVSYGLGILNSTTYRSFIKENLYDKDFEKDYFVWRNNIESATLDCVYHNEFLEELKS